MQKIHKIIDAEMGINISVIKRRINRYMKKLEKSITDRDAFSKADALISILEYHYFGFQGSSRYYSYDSLVRRSWKVLELRRMP